MAARTIAGGYQDDVTGLGLRVLRLMLELWRKVTPGDISASWAALLPQATALLAAGQTVAAELADPYLDAVAPGPAGGEVVPDSFAGATLTGEPLSALLFRPAIAAKEAIALGAPPTAALGQAQAPLAMYVRSETTDAARQAVSAGMGTRPHITGFYRMLQLPSCDDCAILAGKFFARNQGFERHPRCDCVHIPVSEADDSLEFDPRAAILSGQVTGLNKDQLRAIELGADPAQIVNANRSLYTTADGRYRYTREGTTRRGVAGARILARDAARLRGEDVTGRFFDDLTFTRQQANEYVQLLRRGVKHTRLTKTGRVQSYSYRRARTARPTPEQIMHDAPSQDEAVRALINFGYILDRRVIDQARQDADRSASFGDRAAAAATGDRARAAAPLSLLRPSTVRGQDALRPDEAFELSAYKGAGYGRINPWLRGGADADDRPDLAAQVGQIDAAMARSPLAADVVVHRGIVDPARVFGDAASVNLAGAVWTERAYVSTSTVEDTGRLFALLGGEDGEAVVMRILVPAGTGAVELSNGDYEAELLLQRGLRLRVVADTGPGTRPRVLDVEVLT